MPPPLRPNVLATAMVGWAVVNPLGLFITGPVLDAFGTTPVLIGFAAVQTVAMAIVSLAAARELGRAAARARAQLSSFALPVSAAKPACRKSFAAAAPSDHVSSRPKRGATICVRREPGGGPGADAARAGDELADRLLHAAVRTGSSSSPRAASPANEGLADRSSSPRRARASARP